MIKKAISLFERYKRAKNESNLFDSTAILDSEVKLYLLSEKYMPNILEFARNMSMPICGYFTNIEEITLEVLIESKPLRVLVLEQGTGRFASNANRKRFRELVSLCAKYKKIYAFCTDSLLKEEAMRKSEVRDRDILWDRYKGTYNSLRALRSLGEHYIDEGIENIKGIGYKEFDGKNILNFQGEYVETKDTDGINRNSDLILDITQFKCTGELLQPF